jgi:phosphonoacetaldehyde hydrolase
VPGIEEGLAAGMWTIGVSVSGNEVGLSEPDWLALSDDARAERAAKAAARMRAAGAHFVVPSVADLLPVVDAIEERLARGEAP